MENESWFKSIPSANDLPPFDVDDKDDEESERLLAEQEKIFAPHRKNAMRLLGLNRIYETFNSDEIIEFLKNSYRINAFNQIDTSTHPQQPNRDKKKGIVAELLKKNVLPEQLLETTPLVYLGSGTDIEYPIAMGARDITLVDYIFSDAEARQEVIDRINKITAQEIIMENGTISDRKSVV